MKAPYKIFRGSATTDQQYAYFIPDDSNSVYSYEWNTEQWNELPSCPYRDSALVFFDGTLTTVGGWKSVWTNKLFKLQQRQWVEKYPPMNTARSSPVVVSASGGDYIIVIGGCSNGYRRIDTVELFEVKTRRWYKLTNIPRPFTAPSATICGDQLHVIGNGINAYTCSLQDISSIDTSTTPPVVSWTSLPHPPVTQSIAATLNGELVVIGGVQNGSLVNSIHQLVDGQWVVIGSMSSNREMCLVVNSSPDRMIIVGGWGPAGDSVEECVVV